MVVALLVTTLGACGGSESAGSPRTAGPTTTSAVVEPTEITVSCDRFADTAQRIIEAQYALYYDQDAAGNDSAVDDLVAELDALRDDAPDDVRDALTGLSDGFRSAQRLLADPTPEELTELEGLAQELSDDSRTVTEWIVDQCGGTE